MLHHLSQRQGGYASPHMVAPKRVRKLDIEGGDGSGGGSRVSRRWLKTGLCLCVAALLAALVFILVLFCIEAERKGGRKRVSKWAQDDLENIHSYSFNFSNGAPFDAAQFVSAFPASRKGSSEESGRSAGLVSNARQGVLSHATSFRSTLCVDPWLNGDLILLQHALPQTVCSRDLDHTRVNLTHFFDAKTAPAWIDRERVQQNYNASNYNSLRKFYSKWVTDYKPRARAPDKVKGMRPFPMASAYNNSLISPKLSKEVAEAILKNLSSRGSSDVTTFAIDISDSFSRLPPSSIHCGVIDRQIPHRYCDTRNIALRLDDVPDVSERHKGLDLLPSFGALEARCSLNEWDWFSRGFGGGAAGWMYNGMNIVDDAHFTETQCDAWIETPVFFISRWDTTNPYQFHQDALNTFLVYSLLNLQPDSIQPVLLDSRDRDGPFTLAWSHIFASSHRLLDLRQLRRAVQEALPATGKRARGERGGRTVCFRRGVWGVHGGVSALSRGGTRRDVECESVPVLRAFREFMVARIRISVLGEAGAGQLWRSLPVMQESMRLDVEQRVAELEAGLLSEGSEDGDQAKTRVVWEMKARVITVTYAIRSGSSAGVSMDDGLLFPQTNGLTGEPKILPNPNPKKSLLGRRILNDEAVIARIHAVAQNWTRTRQGSLHQISVQFRGVDFASLPFTQQVAVAQGTDFFIGTHGASFVHLLYLRQQPRAAVLELKPPERNKGNEQFHNLSKRMGHLYEKVSYGLPMRVVQGAKDRFVSSDEMERIEMLVWALLDGLLNERVKYVNNVER
ncbi:hypothetical protein BC830DRAFT_1125608 [Chytriomyces sp. MP71]|nr:hypothetical protein BC830DRAFT_1125608 [Chytriomyces sp. MP71]